jgi:integrase
MTLRWACRQSDYLFCAADRLAEAGRSAHEIMAITGHATLAMVEGYTRGANQKRLAKAAIARLRENGSET